MFESVPLRVKSSHVQQHNEHIRHMKFIIDQGGRGEEGGWCPRESVAQSACQYDVTSRDGDFQNGEQNVHRRDG